MPWAIQIRVSPPTKTPETQVFREFFHARKQVLALFFSLIGSTGGNCADKTLHAVGTFVLHLVGHMTIHVQRKSRCGVAQISLHCLDVISGADRGDSVGVPLRYNNDKRKKP